MSEAISEAQYQAILERRARALAQVPPALGERRLIDTVALVGIGAEVFGVPVDGVREIVRTPPITPLPSLPAWLPGIVQIRGEILNAVHLARWLGIEERGPGPYLVVLAGGEVPCGLLVSSVLGFRQVYADELATELRAGDQGRRPISHTTLDLVSLLDHAALTRSPDLWPAARSHCSRQRAVGAPESNPSRCAPGGLPASGTLVTATKRPTEKSP